MILLSACHLFSPVPTIDCAEGEDCAGGGKDTDTGPFIDPDAPTVGWIVSLDGGTKSKARRYEPDGEMAREWKEFDGALQAIWVEERDEGLFITPDGVYRLNADGSSELLVEGVGVTIHDLAWFNERVLLTVSDDDSSLLAWAPGAESSDVLSTGVGAFGSIAVRGGKARVLYADVQPDLYSVSSAFKATVSEGSFDSDTSLIGGLAIDDQDAVYVCSPTGAVYAVSDLAAGVRTPVAVYDAQVSDVSSCAYDPGPGKWLLAGPSVGVVRLDTSGRAEIIYAPPGGYTISDISFY